MCIYHYVTHVAAARTEFVEVLIIFFLLHSINIVLAAVATNVKFVFEE